jgi:hypothetical protein
MVTHCTFDLEEKTLQRRQSEWRNRSSGPSLLWVLVASLLKPIIFWMPWPKRHIGRHVQ